MSEKTLAELNKAVDDAVAERTKWLDEQMVLRSKIKVGDEIYDLSTCKLLGKVSELYRFHRNDMRYDRTLQTHYRFTKDGQYFENTSCRGYISIGTKEEAAKILRQRAEQLENSEV